MKEIKTNWSKKKPPFGAFDDYIIIESIDQERILIRPEEFEDLTSKLFENWNNRDSKYIQLLKEWNECIGFNDVQESQSILLDIQDTINAIEKIDGVSEPIFGQISKKDIRLILSFLVKHKNRELNIFKE